MYYKTLLLAVFISFITINVNAQDETQTFNYKTTWRIVYFKDDSQFINQRPNDEYNKQQGFIQLYEILIKYVYSMQPLDETEGHIDTIKLGIWDEIFLINDEGYQSLLIGNQILSDGKGWALMNENDYGKLRNILVERSSNKDNLYDGDKVKALNSLSWANTEGASLEDFDTHFQRLKIKNNKNADENSQNQKIHSEKQNTESILPDTDEKISAPNQNPNKPTSTNNSNVSQSTASHKKSPSEKTIETQAINANNNIKTDQDIENTKNYFISTTSIIFILSLLSISYYFWRIKK